MAQVENGNTVTVHYTVTLDDGTVFDSSHGQEPLKFTVGQDQLINGFEQNIVGMAQGESKTFRVPVAEAYGPHLADRVIQVDSSQMPPDLELEIGTKVEGAEPGGPSIEFVVVGLSESMVTLDGNHPLAGKDLNFEVEVIQIT